MAYAAINLADELGRFAEQVLIVLEGERTIGFRAGVWG